MKQPRASKQLIGALGEDLAAAELERVGMEIIARNWRCAVGEIDIIATDRRSGRLTLVFCEVKCRTGLGFGNPLEAITYAKLRKLRQLAAEWLTTAEVSADGIRLDAIGVVMLRGQPPQLTHVLGIG